MKIAEYLSEQLMFLDMPCKTKTAVLEFLAQRFCLRYGLTCQEELFVSILQREQIESTGLGHGLAVPHGKTELVDKLYVVFGRSHAGIDWQAKDDKKVHYVFLVIGPGRMINEYLDILSQIGKLLMRKNVCDVFCNTKDPLEIIKVIQASGVRQHKR